MASFLSMMNKEDKDVYLDMLDDSDKWDDLTKRFWEMNLELSNKSVLSETIKCLARKIQHWLYEEFRNKELPNVSLENILLYEAILYHDVELIAVVWIQRIYNKFKDH
jgi:hypothetical protein